MSTISIKDLPESVDLDREAMLAIVGGSRLGGHQSLPVRPQLRSGRIVDFPTGFATYAVARTGGQPAGSKPRK